ncbi:hypothetical protein [Thiocystis violascens]|uniref:Integral membrane protein n=1 Tax=Thiocystis violascens (strain ATCC 17096 / DSM 198 / 6111) TaxID=765911 RepID=I3Y5N9_THIV6|nr:hypothetical protein [Thiocystis violascens]AFL72307.1 hypothetical protein Thivi_0238 [Thiocystis violascens DSM 198]
MKKTILLDSARITLFSSLLIAPLAWQPANAASACKGMEQTACETNAECRWQAGYTRKDNVQVASHCRALPKKKEAATEPAKTVDKPSTP